MGRIGQLGVGVLLLAAAAPGLAQGWSRLQKVKAGSTLIVESGVDPNGFAQSARCKLLRVDATTLTCVDTGSVNARLVYPAKELDAVFEVRRDWGKWIPAFLLVAVGGVLAGGLASGNPTAIGIGLLGMTIAIVVASVSADHAHWDPWYNRRPNPQDAERTTLVYVRGAGSTAWTTR